MRRSWRAAAFFCFTCARLRSWGAGHSHRHQGNFVRSRRNARGTFSQGESFGRYAPSPFTSPLPSMSQGNLNNPTDTTVEGPFNLNLRYRNVPGGFRDTYVDDTLVDYLAGVQGTVDWLSGMDWELGAQYSQAKTDSTSPRLGLASSAGGGVRGERVGQVVRDPGSQQIQTALRPNSNFAKRATARFGGPSPVSVPRSRFQRAAGDILRNYS